MRLAVSIFTCPHCMHSMELYDELFICNNCSSKFKIKNGIPNFVSNNFDLAENSIRNSKLKQLFKKFYKKFPNKSISRISMDRSLIPILKQIDAEVILDIGSKNTPYRKYLNPNNYYSTDISYNFNLDFVSDIYKLPIKDESIDCVICTEVLEHLENPKQAIDNIYRILKPGSICVLTTRFLFPFHPDPNDYFRYTEQGLRFLFSNFKSINIIGHGNSLQLIIYIITRAKILRVLLYPFIYLFSFNMGTNRSKFAFGYIVKAIK